MHLMKGLVTELRYKTSVTWGVNTWQNSAKWGTSGTATIIKIDVLQRIKTEVDMLIHMHRFTYFTIVPQMTPRIFSSLLHQDEKSDVFLSPHVRLCGCTAMAHI